MPTTKRLFARLDDLGPDAFEALVKGVYIKAWVDFQDANSNVDEISHSVFNFTMRAFLDHQLHQQVQRQRWETNELILMHMYRQALDDFSQRFDQLEALVAVPIQQQQRSVDSFIAWIDRMAETEPATILS